MVRCHRQRKSQHKGPGTGDPQVEEGNAMRTHLSLTLSGKHRESWAEAPAGILRLLYLEQPAGGVGGRKRLWQ